MLVFDPITGSLQTVADPTWKTASDASLVPVSTQDVNAQTKALITQDRIYLTAKSPFPLAGWGYRKAITVSHQSITSDLTNQRLLVSVSDADLYNHALSSGYDIRFTSSDGVTILPYERWVYNRSNNTVAAQFWVKVPTLSHTLTNTIYMYYGNPSASDESSTSGVWGNDTYLRAWHGGQRNGSIDLLDCAEGYNLTNHGVGGQSDGTWAFYGSQWLTGPTTNLPSGGTQPFTLQFNLHNYYENATILEWGSSGHSIKIIQGWYYTYILIDGVQHLFAQGYYNNMYAFAVTYDGAGNWKTYVSSNLTNSFTATPTTVLGSTFTIGDSLSANSKLQGYIQELRFSNYAKSAAEITWDSNQGTANCSWDAERTSADSYIKYDATNHQFLLYDMGVLAATISYANGFSCPEFPANSVLMTDQNKKITAAQADAQFSPPFYFQNSVQRISNLIQLYNDNSSPGPNMVYGTNVSGTKGWMAAMAGELVTIIYGGNASSTFATLDIDGINGGGASTTF